jgi:hypothetical protein
MNSDRQNFVVVARSFFSCALVDELYPVFCSVCAICALVVLSDLTALKGVIGVTSQV